MISYVLYTNPHKVARQNDKRVENISVQHVRFILQILEIAINKKLKSHERER